MYSKRKMFPVLRTLGVRGPRRLANTKTASALMIFFVGCVMISMYRLQVHEVIVTSSFLQTDYIEMNILAQASKPTMRDGMEEGVAAEPAASPPQADRQSGDMVVQSSDVQAEDAANRPEETEVSRDLAPSKHESHHHAKHKRHHHSSSKHRHRKSHHHRKHSKEKPTEPPVEVDVSKFHFPDTKTLLRFQERRFFSPKAFKSHWSLNRLLGLNDESKKEGILVKDIVYPSLLAANNTPPFKAGPCYRQVHLWAKEGRSFSRRVGDFPCPGLPCGVRLVVDNDLGTLESSDAVIMFHRTKLDWAELHRHKPQGQKWIFYTQENPLNTGQTVIPPKEFQNNSYDFIMSYRFREAHLYGAYGRYNTDHPEMKFTAMRNWAKNKTKSIAWVASNCNMVSWDRKGFVEALSRYIPVSMYGKCGTKSCPRDERCSRSIRKHKFYLAFENSPCRDYITEKLWRNALLNDVVPVVYGAPREDYERVLPPESFIHVEDFDSIKELAIYLRKLIKDEGLYNTYFEWKKFGSIQLTIEEYLFEPEQMCSNIVSRLLADENAMREGTYRPPKFPDWTQWWTNSCKAGVKWPIKLK